MTGMPNWLLKPVLSALAPAGAKSRLSILIYHRVLPTPDAMLPGDPDAATFRWQMQLVARCFNPLPLGEAVERLSQGTLPVRPVCVTFDDGYADNLHVAMPILREAGVPATFFIAAGYLDGGRMFNDTIIEGARRLPDGKIDLGSGFGGARDIQSDSDRSMLAQDVIRRLKYMPPQEREQSAREFATAVGQPLPDDLMMTTAELRRLAEAGMEIGAHTISHPILAELDAAKAAEEILGGKRRLESLLQRPVTLFAYPNGRPDKDYTAEHVRIVRESGFLGAVSTAPGVAARGHTPFELPRFTPWDKAPARFALRMARNLAAPASRRAAESRVIAAGRPS